jgi:WD40 repeat protein
MKLGMAVRTFLTVGLALLSLLPQVCLFATVAREGLTDKRFEPALIKCFRVPGRLGSLAFDSKGEKLVTVGWRDSNSDKDDAMQAWRAGKSRGDIRIWSIASGTEIAHFGDDAGGFFDVAISPDDKTIVTAGRVLGSPTKGEARIWDAKAQRPIRTLEGHRHFVVSVAYSPDGKLIATGSIDRSTRVWDAATGKQLVVLNFSKMLPRSLRFSADGKTLVAGYETGSVVLWDVATWTKRHTFDAKGILLYSADLSSEGKRVVAGGVEKEPKPEKAQGGRIHVWDVDSGREEQAIQLEHMVSGVAFSPGGKYFAAAASPVSRIWASGTGEDVGDFRRASSTSGDKIRFSPDGKRLAIGGLADATLWDVSGLGTGENAK